MTPRGRKPTFAQTYFLNPDDASKMRMDDLSSKMKPEIKRQIIQTLEKVMRTNPFGRTFATTGEMIEKAKMENEGEMPRFQVVNPCFFFSYYSYLTFKIVLLSDRELNEDAIQSCGGAKIIERADAPTAKQVACIWVDEQGLAPKVHGTPIFCHNFKMDLFYVHMVLVFL